MSTLQDGPNPTLMLPRKVADRGQGRGRDEDVHAEAKKRLANAASDLRGLQGGVYLIQLDR
jgi:hypothetical protein